MNRYGVTEDYEYNATHKRHRLEVWSDTPKEEHMHDHAYVTDTVPAAWRRMLDNFVELNGNARDIDTEAGREYLRGGFEILRDACPWGQDHDERAEITAALVYAHRRWNGPELVTLGAW